MNSSRQEQVDQTRLTCLSWSHWNYIRQSHPAPKLNTRQAQKQVYETVSRQMASNIFMNFNKAML